MIPHIRGDSAAVTLQSVVDDRLRSVVGGVSASHLREVLQDAVNGGKRLRPMLAMLSCAAAGGQELDALDAGVACELIHVASLVHDDVMDASEMRRGRPTVHVGHGIPTAILAGDALIALAFGLVHEIHHEKKNDIVRLFNDALLGLCEGQSADLHGLSDLGGHATLVEKKTAGLLEAAAGMGAMIASADVPTVRALRLYGRSLGMAYQALDDLLDVVGESSLTGKPAGADARNGRATYLTLAHPAADPIADARGVVTRFTQAAVAAAERIPPSVHRMALIDLAVTLSRRTS